MVAVMELVAELTRVMRLEKWFETQTAPSATASEVGCGPVSTLAMTLLVAASSRSTEPLAMSANQSARVCLTSSFQAEDMVVAHLLVKRVPNLPVLFLDTGYHFPQTYEYRDRMTKQWSLNLVNVLPTQTVAEQESAFGILYRSEPTRCCELRKVEPLMRALAPLRAWVTGQRKEHSPGTRDALQAGDGLRRRQRLRTEFGAAHVAVAGMAARIRCHGGEALLLPAIADIVD